MSRRRLFAFGGVLLLSGCLYHVADHTDQTVCDLAAHPYDLSLPPPAETAQTTPAPSAPAVPGKDGAAAPAPATDVCTAAFMQAEPSNPPVVARPPVKVPADLPGAETPLLPVLPKGQAEREAAVRKLYPPLPPLPEEAVALPGPNGQPYTLADLQRIAAGNSPTLRQAASDVEAARGNLQQAWAYPNPTVSYVASPSSDGSTPGSQGIQLSQTLKTFGKLKLAAASQEKAVQNAELALKRARGDLSTQVRNAYYALLVAKETVRVNKALARFTDDVYLFQEDLLEKGGQAAPYEPAALRAQAYTARLAYKQAIQTYAYSWKQLVAAVGLRQLPLTEVAGRIDAFIPYYDYDTVLAHVLKNHTDVLTAYNGIDAARYNLKLAQITPYPDLSLQVAVAKDFVVPPQQASPSVQIGAPIPIWDQNKGAIIAAEAALVRAGEEPHRVETVLTTNLAAAYAGYKNNIDALEYYRKYILPDLVRTVRGVEERRRFDPALQFTDLVQAQQNLSTSVTSYLAILGQLWTSTVSVADLLQTDDLFQLAQPRELPPLPDLEQLPPLPCGHPCGSAAGAACSPAAVAKTRVVAPFPVAKTELLPALPATAPSQVIQAQAIVPPLRQNAPAAKTAASATPARDPLLEPPPVLHGTPAPAPGS